MRGQPQRVFRRFIATTASMRSWLGPFGPGRRRRLGENNMRYFRWRSTLWRCSRVEGFRTMEERRKRSRAHEQGTQAGDDPMNEYDSEVAHLAMVSTPQKPPLLGQFGNSP